MLMEMMQRIGDRARRMGQMMDRLKVDVAALAQARNGAEFVKAQARCAGCTHIEQCERSHEAWLAGRRAQSPDQFCPNWDTFSQFRERR